MSKFRSIVIVEIIYRFMEIFQIGVMPRFTELEYSLAGEALGYWVTKPQLEVGDLDHS